MKKLFFLVSLAVLCLCITGCPQPADPGNNTTNTRTYTVTFKANGGGGSNYTQTFEHGVPQNLTANTFTREGYIFIGWDTQVDPFHSPIYADKESYTAWSNATLYAQWEETRTVIFDANGGQGSMQPQIFSKSFREDLKANTFIKDGYAFAGWSKTSSGEVQYFDEQQIDNENFGDQREIILYAVWGDAITVTFNANGGQGTMQPQIFLKDTYQQLQPNTFTKEGAVFAGWSTTLSIDETIFIYSDEDSFHVSEDTILYAVWRDPITVTFNANGGEGTMPPQIFPKDIPQYLTQNTFTKEGYAFAGWATTPNGQAEYEAEHGVSHTYTLTESITLYVVWAKAFTVTYDKNHTDYITDLQTQEFVEGITQYLDGNFYREGYTFAGWATAPNGQVEYADSAEYTATKDITLYAVWGSITVTFDKNHAEANNNWPYLEKQGFIEAVPQQLQPNTFTRRDGYAFAGWATTPTGDVEYTDKEEISVTENITLYVVWQAIIVTFDANGGEGTMSSQSLADVVSPELTRNSFTKEGYGFAGWSTTPNGEIEYYNKNEVYSNYIGAPNLTLYAVWGYNVTLDGNGGTVSWWIDGEEGVFDTYFIQVFEKNVTQQLQQNRFSRYGYVFAGWSTTQNGQATYDEKAEFTATASTTLYATWEAKTIHFYANGGTGTMERQSYADEQAQNLTQNTFIKDGYAFAGWSTTPNGQVEYADEEWFDSYIFDTQIFTLYAVWGYTVTFDTNDGTGSTQTQEFIENVPKPLTPNNFTRSGYVFMGWSTTQNGQVEYDDEAEFTSNGNTTLYAVWEVKTIVFNANGGDGTMSSQSFESGSQNLNENSFERDRYAFMGWSTTANGQAVYDDEEWFDESSFYTPNLTLYAVWAREYTITFNANDGYGSMYPVKTTGGASLPTNTFSRSGYVFTGWSKNSDGNASNPTYTDESYISVDSDTTLYAMWVELYTITFHPNSGSGSSTTQEFRADEWSVTLDSNTFTRDGYAFAGWSTTSYGEVEYNNKHGFYQDIQSLDGLPLYAVWDALITFNAGVGYFADGSDKEKSFTVTEIDNWSYLPVVQVSGGNVEVEWYVLNNETSKDLDDIKALSSPTTLYADWTNSGLGFVKKDGYSYTVTYADKGVIRGEFEIPTRHKGRPVTAIGDNVFSGNTYLTKITVPNSVTHIGNSAFSGCTKLNTVKMSGVTHIGANAFSGCTGLEDAYGIDLPDSLTHIGANAFSGCSNLNHIVIPKNVTNMGLNAFDSCGNLLRITVERTEPIYNNAIWHEDWLGNTTPTYGVQWK